MTEPTLLDESAMSKIEARIAKRDDTTALESACGEYNCSCHYDLPALCATVKHLREMMADPVFGFQELQTRLAQMQKDRDYWRTRATEAEKAAEKWYSDRY